MPSKTKATILQHHQQNRLLNTAMPPLAMRNPNDLSADDLLAPLDERVIEATVSALESGQTHYVDVPGIGPLREALAKFLNSSAGTSAQMSNVLVTAGVQESRFLSIHLISEQLGKIAIPSVVHPGVRKTLGIRPLETIEVDVDAATMLPTLTAIRAALSSGAKLIYLESPSRLTGATYSAEDVAAIAELIHEHDAAAIWDQGLAVWADSSPSLAAQQGMAERVAVIGEAWPGMGLTSWHIGYIVAPEPWIAPMQSQKQIMSICTSTASQYAALEASNLFEQTYPEIKKQLNNARQQLLDTAKLDVLQGGAVNILAIRSTADIERLQSAGYDVADGAAFGAPGVVRITITGDDTAQNIIEQLA